MFLNIVIFIIFSRRVLVDWTSKVAEKLQLTNCTVHLAVKIVDYFMDGHDIQVEYYVDGHGVQIIQYRWSWYTDHMI